MSVNSGMTATVGSTTQLTSTDVKVDAANDVKVSGLAELVSVGRDVISRAAGGAMLIAGDESLVGADDLSLYGTSKLSVQTKKLAVDATESISTSTKTSRLDATTADIVVGSSYSTYAGGEHDTFATVLDYEAASTVSTTVGESASLLSDSLSVDARSGITVMSETLDVDMKSNAMFSANAA